jgi:hypothetical protein
MSVRAKVANGKGFVKPNVVAADIMKSEHPLHQSFMLWCKDRTIPTKRQARKFLKKNPQYAID